MELPDKKYLRDAYVQLILCLLRQYKSLKFNYHHICNKYGADRANFSRAIQWLMENKYIHYTKTTDGMIHMHYSRAYLLDCDNDIVANTHPDFLVPRSPKMKRVPKGTEKNFIKDEQKVNKRRIVKQIKVMSVNEKDMTISPIEE